MQLKKGDKVNISNSEDIDPKEVWEVVWTDGNEVHVCSENPEHQTPAGYSITYMDDVNITEVKL